MVIRVKHYQRLGKKQYKADNSQYVESVESDLERNPRKLWKHFKSRCVKRFQTGIVLVDVARVATSDVCNSFARHFKLIYNLNPSDNTFAAVEGKRAPFFIGI